MSLKREMATVRAGEAEICVESIGDGADPAILLIGGAASSMDWWEEELCERLGDGGRRVVRYDNRDTGQSTTWPAGSPGYSEADLVADAIAILDALSIRAAHVVGLSMGGGIGQLLALKCRDRVATLTLMSTTPIVYEGAELPGMTSELQAGLTEERPEPNWDDRASVVDYMVEGERRFAGPGSFDEGRMRALAGRVYDRSRDLDASMTNHFLLGDDDPGRHRLGELAGLPTLVIHGSADAMFPPAHGRALADQIPGARLIELEDVGHQYPPARSWDLVIESLLAHTAQEP